MVAVVRAIVIVVVGRRTESAVEMAMPPSRRARSSSGDRDKEAKVTDGGSSRSAIVIKDGPEGQAEGDEPHRDAER